MVKYELDLYNNFTWFLTDPVNGDQFHQHDDRVYGGAGASRTINGSLFGLPTETVFGIQTRYDDIDVRPEQHRAAQFLSKMRSNHDDEGNGPLRRQHGALDRLAAGDAGLARRLFRRVVNPILQPANSGYTRAAIGQSEVRGCVRSVQQDGIIFGAGMGYHSNDARGAQRSSPVRFRRAANRRAAAGAFAGAEVGVRSKSVGLEVRPVCSSSIWPRSFLRGRYRRNHPGTPEPGASASSSTNDYRPAVAAC